MKGARPEQAEGTRGTAMSKTAAPRAGIEGMGGGRNAPRLGAIGEFFAEGFGWNGNQG